MLVLPAILSFKSSTEVTSCSTVSCSTITGGVCLTTSCIVLVCFMTLGFSIISSGGGGVNISAIIILVSSTDFSSTTSSLASIFEITGKLTANENTKEPINKANKDRKSTRLNSSHVRISYAVFCLK